MVINDGVSATDAAAATPSSGKAPDSYGNAVAAAVESPSSLPQQQRYDGNEQQRILSRKRRYLIFPQGSSLQLGKFPCVHTMAIARAREYGGRCIHSIKSVLLFLLLRIFN